jgi:hypothetical protein
MTTLRIETHHAAVHAPWTCLRVAQWTRKRRRRMPKFCRPRRDTGRPDFGSLPTRDTLACCNILIGGGASSGWPLARFSVTPIA